MIKLLIILQQTHLTIVYNNNFQVVKVHYF